MNYRTPCEWFAFTNNEDIVSCGVHEDFCAADGAAPDNTVWILNEYSLRSLQVRIEAALDSEPTQDEVDAMQSEAAHRARLADVESICPPEVNDTEAAHIQSEKGVRE